MLNVACGVFCLSCSSIRTLSCGMWDLVPGPGTELRPPMFWKCGVLANTPLGKSLGFASDLHHENLVASLEIKPIKMRRSPYNCNSQEFLNLLLISEE